MRLYVTRHGRTEWNRLNKALGRTDIPLDEAGIQQAHELAAALAGEPIDLALCSPLSRARTTCEIVCGELGVPWSICPELIEHNFGIFEGVDRADPIYQREKRRYFARFEGGESFLDVAARVYPLLDRLQAEHAGESVLLVAHTGIARVICSYFRPMENEEFFNFQLGNCGVLEFDC